MVDELGWPAWVRCPRLITPLSGLLATDFAETGLLSVVPRDADSLFAVEVLRARWLSLRYRRMRSPSSIDERLPYTLSELETVDFVDKVRLELCFFNVDIDCNEEGEVYM